MKINTPLHNMSSLCYYVRVSLSLPHGTLINDARRRWVLLQAMPPFAFAGGDIFGDITTTLHSAAFGDMEAFIHATLTVLVSRAYLFPADENLNGLPPFVVVDKAQVAAHIMHVFQSPSKKIRPLLQAFY